MNGQRDHDLRIYAKVMKVFKTLYESTDGLLRCTGKIMTFARLSKLWQLSNTAPVSWKSDHLAKTETEEPFSDNDWINLLVRSPQSYIRIALTIESLLSCGRLPSENEFPRSLRM